MLRYLINMLQLFLSPTKGWEEVARLNESPNRLMDKGFYPVLALVAITAFGNGIYGSEPFSIGSQLLKAIAQCLALFFGVMLGRATFESLLSHFTGQQVNVLRAHTVVIYCVGLMAMVQVFINVCPIELSVLWFLPAFVALVAWQSHDYLGVKSERGAQFFIFAVAMLIIVPIVFNKILDLIV